MRFHVLGLPHTVTSKEFSACAYTQKVVKFGKMMVERGHEVLHYGHEDSNLQCTEHITVLTNDDFMESYGSHDWRKTFFKFDTSDLAYRKFYDNAIREVGKRKRQHDFILPFWGAGVRPVCDAHPDLICVEPGIGYAGGHWARWKVFESYAIYHAYCGLQNVGTCRQDWYEVVIPNYFDPEDFEYRGNDEKEDYFLYLGRVYGGKGVDVAIQATERAGVKLVIAGQKEEGYHLPSHVEYVGYADAAKRKELMSKARGSILASMYVEPFGGVQIENLFSGTPTLTTDWGSFAENNLHGVTGYRCRTMGDFVEAIRRVVVGEIQSWDCRIWAENFSLTNVAPMYEKYFADVLSVYKGEGWYGPCNGIDAMFRRYP
jgi:glycosyltransferase involved in cell wall biosynthesis